MITDKTEGLKKLWRQREQINIGVRNET